MDISILISTQICLHTALPYIFELRKQNVAIHYIVAREVREEASSLLKDASSVVSIDTLSRKHTLAMLVHSFLRIAFTRQDYSPSYGRWLAQRFKHKNLIITVLSKWLIKFGPKWRREEINQKLAYWIRKILPNPFPTSRLINITATGDPHLLCARGLRVYTILESWDHPCKAPVGHSSERVFVWNDSLRRDWYEYQGDSNISISYPIKLGYALNANKLKKTELIRSTNNRIMYSATFGATSDPSLFNEELRLIEEICKVTQDSGKKLLIKPKPNGTFGELDQFLKFPHIEIGKYQHNRGGANYHLSDKYNNNRLSELQTCDIVINLGTTFALDAAAFGLPVVQLKIDCQQHYPCLSALTTFPHLARHFYSKPECIFTIAGSGPVSEELAFLGETSNYIQSAEAFSLYLREWIMPNCTLDKSVANVVRACLGQKCTAGLDDVKDSQI